MTRERKIKFNALTALVGIFIVIILSISYNIIEKIDNSIADLDYTVKKTWRRQGQRTLDELRNVFIHDVLEKNIDPRDELSAQAWADKNISGVRNGGATSDAFMINMKNEKFIYDGSIDCQKPEFVINGRYMKDESQMHKNPELAECVLSEMRLLYDTKNSHRDIYWEFDDSPELLEWVIIPNDKLGFDNITKTDAGLKNQSYQSYLLALGTQADEIMEPYQSVINKLNDSKKMLINVNLMMIVAGVMFLLICMYNDFKANGSK